MADQPDQPQAPQAPIAELERLATLRERGALTTEEFDALKQLVLGRPHACPARGPYWYASMGKVIPG